MIKTKEYWKDISNVPLYDLDYCINKYNLGDCEIIHTTQPDGSVKSEILLFKIEELDIIEQIRKELREGTF